MKNKVLIGLIIFLLTLTIAFPVLAEEEIEVTGAVVSVGDTSFDIELEDGTIYTVIPPEDFVLEGLSAGYIVEVEGELEDETITAFKIVIETEENDDEEEEVGTNREDNFFCMNPQMSHPALHRLAERYEADYEEVLAYFCETNYGIGEIMLAFATSKKLDDESTVLDMLEMKTEMNGWGKVWQSLGMIGRPEHAGPPDHVGPPDHAGPPDHVEPRHNDKK